MYRNDIDFKGELLSKTQAFEDAVETLSLSYESLQAFREQFPAWMDADSFDLKK